MGIQQIPDQVKRAPTQGLRAVFSGIGRILMAADRPQAGTAEQQAGTAAPPAATAEAASGTQRRRPAWRSRSAPAALESRFRSLDQTGNVRLLSGKDLDDHDADPDPAADPEPGADAAQAAATSPPGLQPEPGPGLVPPLPDYDSLSLASIRARLRGLDVPALRALLEYESKNAERAEVLGMVERRIEKVESGG
jgi:hypothetical protein